MTDELKSQRNDFEDLCLARMSAVLRGIKVPQLADPGFSDTKMFDYLGTLGALSVGRTARTQARQKNPTRHPPATSEG